MIDMKITRLRTNLKETWYTSEKEKYKHWFEI